MAKRIMLFTFDTSRMTEPQLANLSALVGVAPEPTTSKWKDYHVDTTGMSIPYERDLAVEIFDRYGTSGVCMSYRTLCNDCGQPRTPDTNECGNYGRGLCS